MKKKTKYYLVGNAHLDPVWLWRWQEGSAEAKATIRSALDRMNEFPEFKFVCSSASVYMWVEEFSKTMFEEIKQRVREGRFIIVGGWHVQPDCNLPSGEGFARQTLYAQRYFMEKFGVTATVGYDVDSFGHNIMLPQILSKSGMDSYIFMRPGPKEKEMSSDLFKWVSPDGSSVTAYRIFEPYCFNFSNIEELEERMNMLDDNTATDIESIPFFYGVGNHGGGPTIRHLNLLAEYSKAHPNIEMHYSNLTDFFDEVRKNGTALPEHHDDLQHHASGCYSTVNQVKNGVRRNETNLTAAEAYSVLAGKLCGRSYSHKKFADAWRNVCFMHFHDYMGGCCYKEVYNDTYMIGMADEVAAVAENNALQTISWAVDTSDREKGLPVFVFNANGFDVDELVQINRRSDSVADSKGNIVTSQHIASPTIAVTERSDTIFRANVPALGYAVYYLKEANQEKPAPAYRADDDIKPVEGSTVNAIPFEDDCRANNHNGTVLENEFYRVQFEMYSGYITSFVDKRTGEEIITGRAAVPTVIDEYYHDTWSHAKNFFTDTMARFSDAEVTLLENGPVRATVKVVSRYNNSVLTQYFSLSAGCNKMEVRAKIDWHEKHKMLKLAWPMSVEKPRAFYEIPFGVIERPADGEEEPGISWTAVKDGIKGSGYAIINNNTYSSSVQGNTIYHTILRSPIYSDHGGPRIKESEFTEQGSHEFRYSLMPVGESWAPIIRAARQLNKPTTNIVETWHSGDIKKNVYSAININADNVVLSAIKRSEDESGLVIRLYEVDGKKTAVTVGGELIRVPLKTVFTPYSMRTFILPEGKDSWHEVLLSEYDMQ